MNINIRILVFLVIGTFIFFSCKKTNTSTALIVHIPQEPEDLHPTNGNSALRSELFLYTQLSLLKTNYESGEIIPCVSKRLPTISKNELVYTYEIDSNLTWDNQTPISPNDVAFTAKANICLLTNNMASKSNWDNIKGISFSTHNKKLLEVEMKQKSSFNMWVWVDNPILQKTFFDKKNTLEKYSIDELRDSVFISKHTDIKEWAVEFNNIKYATNPLYMNGAGVYKISKWNKGASITLEKKQNHWSEHMRIGQWDKAESDKIIFKINSNNASAMLELKNGTMDVSTYLDFNSYLELAHDKAFTQEHLTTLANTYNYTYIAMNTKPDGKKHKLLFNDIWVRKAMSYIIPYNQINKLIYDNKCQRAVGPVSILKKDFNQNLKPIESNIQKALELLKQAGWEDTDNDQILDKVIDGKKISFEFSINFMNAQKQWEDIAKQIAEEMRKAKIFVQLNPLDYNGYLGSAMNHDFDMTLGAWQTTLQPDDFTQLWHSNSWKNNGFNFTGFGNNYSDALIDSINSSVNDSKRISFSKQFQTDVYNQQPYIFLFAQVRRIVVNKKWQGVSIYNEYPNLLLNHLYLENK